ncbi:anti-sigma factor [Sphingomonas populi]|uniref:Anti-sigma factor n=1 Tax=Sphingomonas populi TaxID=2484750 RepID=A0A4Q6XKY5_9SPHN|nr:anti-sigma factor [Sphingomonas populi]RZF60551.1 anti-sigma factor [Sphingomonas populi]
MTSPVGDDDLMAWIDGRLSPERQPVVAAFLSAHPDVRMRLINQAEQARALAAAFAPVAAQPIPAAMRIDAIRERRRRPGWHAALAASLLLAVGYGGGWMSARQFMPASAGIKSLEQEATDNYRVFAIDTPLPGEMRPDNGAGLIRAASIRFGRRVAIPDLRRSGYRYAGGQLVATPHGPAALFLYNGAGSTSVALLTRPMKIDKSAPMAGTRDGDVGRVSWALNGMGYSVVGARSPEALHPIAEEAQRQLSRT